MAPMNPLPLVSMDVSHFYTNILKDAGIVACKEDWEQWPVKYPP